VGTSGAFKGSAGKDAKDLRDTIADWLGDTPASAADGAADGLVGDPGDGSRGKPNEPHLDPRSLVPALRLWIKPSGSGSSGGAGGSGGGGGRRTSGGRSTGGMQRSVSRVAGPASRAGALARAYATGDRQTIEDAGLSYDELRALDDPFEVGRRITEVAFESRPEEGLEDSEARLIVAELVSWLLEARADRFPAPDAIVRRTLELMIARATLHEVGATIRAEKDPAKRRATESEVRRAAGVMAQQANLSETGASSAALGTAIERSVAELVDIFGGTT
jgi:hypothetical protein